jgi:hypothetical protein
VHESILKFRKRRYLWVSIAIAAIAIIAYWIHDPQEPPNGGTALGYTLGVFATAIILWLTWFGVRKRSYSSTQGTVQGWLSAHVYVGVVLLLVVLLHSGFQYGPNIHTLALVLMVLVIASGLYGVYVYMKYPTRLSQNRGGVNRSELLDELEDIDSRSRRVAAELDAQYQEVVASGIRRTQLGGSMLGKLRGQDRSQIMLPVSSGGQQSSVVSNAGQEAVLDWLAEQQSRSSDAALAGTISELSALLRNKRKLLKQLGEELRLQATLEIWLYVHVPLTAALLVAVVAHILTVFIYW